MLNADGTTLTASVTHFTVFVILQPFIPFAAPTLPSGTNVKPLGIVSTLIPFNGTAPTFGIFTPPSGLVGDPVVITGTGFLGSTSVTFNGVSAAFTVDSAVQISTTVPASATTVPISVTNPAGTATSATDFTVIVPTADLTISKTHTGNFTQGQIGATYTITVSNVGVAATIGTVTVIDTLPAGLTAMAISGTGWSCTLATLTCTRSDALATTASYPDITLTVDVGGSVLAGGLFGTAFAGDTNDDAILYSISSVDGTATAIGPTGFAQVGGIDFHSSGVLYGLGHRISDNEEVLITIDPVTGVGTEVGPTNVFGMYPDIAFRPSDGALFGMQGRDLYSINTATGAAALVGATGLSGGGNGLAFSSANVLYLANGQTLYTVNTTDAVPTVVTTLDFSAFPDGTSARVNGMQFDPSMGILWASVNDGGPILLGTINLTTGVVANIGATATDLEALAVLGSAGGLLNTAAVSGGGEVNTTNNTADDATIVFPVSGPSGPIITAVAGTGTFGFSGDGGPATSASLTGPIDVTVDASGNIFFTDSGNRRIRRVDASTGIITTVAGTGAPGFSGDGGPATSADLRMPGGLLVDAQGNLFFADGGNNRIRRVDASTGIITTVAGNGTRTGDIDGPGGDPTDDLGDGGQATSATLDDPFEVVLDPIGNLYITELRNNRVRRVDAITGIITTVAGNGTATGTIDGPGGNPLDDLGDGGPATSASLNFILGLELDLVGNLYIGDSGNNRIRKVDASTGIITTVAGNGTPTGTIDGPGGDPTDDFLDGVPAISASLRSPAGLVFDAAGNLYVGDEDNHSIRKVDTGGTITTVAGDGTRTACFPTTGLCGDGGPATSALLNHPFGVTVDSTGNLYFADDGLNRIRKVTGGAIAGVTAAINQAASQADPTSTSPINFTVVFNENVTGFATGDVTLSGTAGATTATVTGSGALYNVAVTGMTTGGTVIATIPAAVATGAITGLPNAASVSMDDTVTFSLIVGPIITTVAGGGFSDPGDGGPATSAQLNQPREVTVDASGNLFISERLNHRIRKVDTAGTITTVAGTGTQGFSGDGGPATSADLNTPTGVAVDAAGNLFITGNANHRIRKVNTVGTITTVAGTGTQGFSGDGGPATSADLNNPQEVAVDASGNLYIADDLNHRIRRVDASTGIITTVAGDGTVGFSGDGGPATSASLTSVVRVRVDLAGNIYIGDGNNHRVRRVDASTGIITTVAGTGTQGFSGDGGPATSASLNRPGGVGFDAAGNLYFAEVSNQLIRKVDASTGIITTVAGNGTVGFAGDGGPATSANLNTPAGVVADSGGDLYISDVINHRIRKVTGGTVAGLTAAINQAAGQADPTSGSPINFTVVFNENVTDFATGDLTLSGTAGATTATVTGSGALYNVAVTGMTGSGTVIASIPGIVATGDITGLPNAPSVSIDNTVTSNFVPLINTVAGNGTATFGGDGSPATSASLNRPNGVAVDAAGNLYIADRSNHRIRKVDTGGIITTVAGNGTGAFSGDGGPATSASLNFPGKVAADAAGNVYITDDFNQRIRKVDAATGIITTVADGGFGGAGGPATSASLNQPKGVAVDAAGNLFIADRTNHRIRKVDTAGVIATVAGNGTAGFSGDGGSAASAQLNQPNGLAVDTAGNLYIAEVSNHRIRKVDTAGIITTVAGNGTSGFSGDGGPATSAVLFNPIGIAVDAVGNLFIVDNGNHRIRKVDAATGIITTVAGDGTNGFSGDGGAATSASLNFPRGVAVDAAGNLYIGDTSNHRGRRVPGGAVAGLTAAIN